MIMKRLGNIGLLVLAITATQAKAQHFGLTNSSEIQTSSNGQFNFVDLLRLEAGLNLGKGFKADFASIHVCKSSKERILDDRQTFSNIEEDNMAGSIALLGLTWEINGLHIFAGTRNLNEDYFISETTSLFTNSSCGIFPTISADGLIANYPLSAMGIDIKYETNKWLFETSVYNGKAGKGFKDGGCFRIRPRHDGVFAAATINYESKHGNYFMGGSFHRTYCAADEEGTEKCKISNKERIETEATLWTYAEIPLMRKGVKEANLLLQYSENPITRQGCRRYTGVGLVMNNIIMQKVKNSFGIFFNRAQFVDGTEYANEVTWQVYLGENLALQAALHNILENKRIMSAFLLRMTYEFMLPACRG